MDRPKKKEAVKKVIAAMTVGKDVSMLFPDVVNCMQTEDLELKKLVYLYLINYAKTQPDLAIMAVNTFVKASTRYVRTDIAAHTPQASSGRLLLDLAMCTTAILAGLTRPEPPHPCAGCAHNGLHSSGQDYRVSVRPPAAMPQGALRGLSAAATAVATACHQVAQRTLQRHELFVCR